MKKKLTNCTLYIRITNSCNLKCRHCCYSCGPGGKTMSDQELETVLSNTLGPNVNRLLLSGGEVFTSKNTLEKALGYVKEHRQQLQQEFKLWVQTNGFWAKDEDSSYNVLKELKEFGVGFIDLTSIDDYHEEQGLDVKNLSPSDSYLDKASQRADINLGKRGTNGRVMPFGRAKSLDRRHHRDSSICTPAYNLFRESSNITINPYGNVYPCCWEITPPLGSALENTLDQIIEKAYNDPVMRALEKGGPQEVAKVLGVFNGKDSYYNECVKCEEIFKALK